MVWVLFGVVAVLVIAVVAGMLAGRIGYDPMGEPTHTAPLVRLPEQPYAADVDDLHFDTAFRGYRMDQVDDVLDQLKARLAAYESATGELPRTTVVQSAPDHAGATAYEPRPDEP